MTKRPWFPFYPADYDRDTRSLSVEQHGVYFLLLKTAWEHNSCSLPNDMNYIRSCLPQMHGHTFTRLVPPILNRFFHLNEAGEWENKRLAKERQTSDKRSANGAQNAKIRWKNNDGAEVLQCKSQSHTQRKQVSTDMPRKRGASKVPLPENWHPMETLSTEDAIEFERMKDWARANAICKADWFATWRNWKRSPYRKTPTNGGGNEANQRRSRKPDGIKATFDAIFERLSGGDEAGAVPLETNPRLLPNR